MIKESPHIFKGNILSLNKLKANDFDAIFIPGGLTSARNFAKFSEEDDY